MFQSKKRNYVFLSSIFFPWDVGCFLSAMMQLHGIDILVT